MERNRARRAGRRSAIDRRGVRPGTESGRYRAVLMRRLAVGSADRTPRGRRPSSASASGAADAAVVAAHAASPTSANGPPWRRAPGTRRSTSPSKRGVVRSIRDGKLSSTPVLDLSDRVSRTAASRASSGSRSRPTGRTSTSTTPTRTATPRSTSSRCTVGTPTQRPGARSSPSRNRSRTTTAVSSRSGPTATSTSASVTAAAPATTARATRRAATASRSTRCSARSCASHRTRTAATRPTRCRPTIRSSAATTPGPRSGRTGSATRGGSRSTATPATSGSATSARTSGRRSTGRRHRRPRRREGRQLRVEPSRGHARVPREPARRRGAAGLRGRARQRPCSVTGGFVYRGTKIPALAGSYLFTDYCDGTLRALVPDGGGGVSLEDTGAEVSMASSFGQSNSGELYVLSLTRRHLPRRRRLRDDAAAASDRAHPDRLTTRPATRRVIPAGETLENAAAVWLITPGIDTDRPRSRSRSAAATTGVGRLPHELRQIGVRRARRGRGTRCGCSPGTRA